MVQSTGGAEPTGRCLSPSQIACVPRCDAKPSLQARLLSLRRDRSRGPSSGRTCDANEAPVHTTAPCAGAQKPKALNGGPAALNGGPAAHNGESTALNGGPAALNGGPTSLNGGPTSLKGGPAALNGGPAALNGGPTSLNGGPAALNGGPAALNGGPAALNGGPAALNGESTALNGGPPHSPPPSPPECACSAAGAAALERTRAARRAKSFNALEQTRAAPSARPARPALPASHGGACLPPNVPMPTSAHVRACLRHAALVSAKQRAEEASRQSFEPSAGPDGTVATACGQQSEPQDAAKSSKSGRGLAQKAELQPWGASRAAAHHPHQLLSVVPGAADVQVPRLRRRVVARCRSLLLSLPLWGLNGLVACGIVLLLSDLSRTQHAESWACFLMFALLLPVLLIWAVGRPEANTKAAWASLKGDTPLHQHVLHFFQLTLIVCVFAASVGMALFTSSGRINRWAKCRWPWMELGGTAGDSVSGLAEVRFFNAWQCGDPFFS